MQFKNSLNNKYLNKIRFTADYYPFSFKYKKGLNAQLYNQALSEHADVDTLSIIQACNYFYDQFHTKLSDEIKTLYDAIPLTREELRELFVGLINEQELLMRIERAKFHNNTDQISAFDIQNSEIVLTDHPDNPQNFVAHSETLIEYANTFFRFLAVIGDNLNLQRETTLSHKEIFKKLDDIVQTSGKYYGIKNHFDGTLFRGGSIEISPDKISFFTSKNGLELIEKVCVTMTENQRLSRNSYYQRKFEEHTEVKQRLINSTSSKILDGISVINGFIVYRLRERELNDFYIHLNYLVSIHDYYSFYAKEPLQKFSNLSITDFLQLHTELNGIVYEIYKLGFPQTNVEDMQIFKMNFVPKIKEQDLKNYLREVSKFNNKQIETFLEVITTSHTGRLNLYATHLLKHENYYYFPFVPALRPNYYFLIDYWLETAEEDLAKRGKALENYLKEQLALAVPREFNKFNLIEKSEFYVSKDNQEEIDLLIQTKNTLIIGEVKCIKYPMYERDYHHVLSDTIGKAVEQLKRKTAFIIKEQTNFPNVYSLQNHTTVQVIITNFPVYTGLSVEGIPIVDINTFLSYFKSGRMTVRTESVDEIEYLEEVPFYKSENEFCNNFASYLDTNPLTERFKNMLKYDTFSYKMPGFPTISYTDVGPIDNANRTYQNS